MKKENKILYLILGFILIIFMIFVIKVSFKNNYDVNNDGKVNSKDLLDLRNYLIEKESDK